MLYRPMVPNDRDILFSGRITKNDNTGPSTFIPEVTHLTCFLGGMVGMGAKIFGLEEHDIEIAKKLSDGCVWAYESMTTGIMPEAAEVYLCEKDTECQWNETLWMKALDPMADQREQQIEDYEIRKANRKAQEEQAALAAQEKARLEAEEKERIAAMELEQVDSKVAGDDMANDWDATDVDVDSPPPVSTRNEEGSADPASEPKPTLQKRQLDTYFKRNSRTRKLSCRALHPGGRYKILQNMCLRSQHLAREVLIRCDLLHIKSTSRLRSSGKDLLRALHESRAVIISLGTHPFPIFQQAEVS
jgi:hypothetical protein